MAVEAEREFVEIGLKVLRAEAVMDVAQPGLEIGEHEVNDGQEGLGNLPVAPFRSGSMKLPAPSERRVAAPVVGDDGGAWRNGASDKADQRFGATIRRHCESDTPVVAAGPALHISDTVAEATDLKTQYLRTRRKDQATRPDYPKSARQSPAEEI